MARGRMLNQRIAEDIDFNAMSIEAQFIFMRTIPFLDRDGLIVGHPALLWSKVAPLLPDFVTQMESIIGEWVDAGFVVRYMEGKAPYLFFPSFSKNQVGLRYDREPASELPTPPGYYRNGNGLEPIAAQPPDVDGGEAQPIQPPDDTPPQTSGNHPADFRQTSGSLPPEEKRIEVEGNTHAREPVAVHRPTPPPPKSNSHKYIDPRKIVGKFVTTGSGDKPYEIWREVFPWEPNLSQIQHMHEHVTDLAKWREVLNDCAARGFKTYQNMFDVYTNGFRAPPDGKQAVANGKVELSVAGML